MAHLTRKKTNLLFLCYLAMLMSCGRGYFTETASSEIAPWIGTKQMGAVSKETRGKGIAVDSLGNVYISGITTGGLDGNALAGTTDSFITKFDSAGVKKWTRQLGVAGALTYVREMTIDTYGNTFITGYTDGALDGNTLTGVADFFITKYDTNGLKLWTRQLGITVKTTQAWSIITDLTGNIFVSGYTNGALDGNVLTGVTDFFISKYDSAGTKQWTKQLGVAAKTSRVRGIVNGDSGNVFVAGYTWGGLDGNSLTGVNDVFLSNYDTAGNRIWTKQLGVAAKSTQGHCVAIDSVGNLFVAGETTGGLDGNTLTGLTDLFMTKYDSSGTKQWTRQLGVASKDMSVTSIKNDTSGNLFIVGSINGGLDGNTLTGSVDLFIIKYDSSGSKIWTRQLGVVEATSNAAKVATDGLGNAYVAGQTQGGLDGNPLVGTVDAFITKYNSAGVKQ